MRKIESKNLQRRASSIPIFLSGNNSEYDRSNKLLFEAFKKRDELIEDLHAIEKRIHEIRTSLKIPKHMSFSDLSNKQSNFPLDCKEVIEWKSCIVFIKDIQEELAKLPKPAHINIEGYMLHVLEIEYPEIHEFCKVRAKTQIEKDLK